MGWDGIRTLGLYDLIGIRINKEWVSVWVFVCDCLAQKKRKNKKNITSAG